MSTGHRVAMQALFVAWYNFGREHGSLKDRTPAMANGLADKVWSIKELIERAAEEISQSGPRTTRVVSMGV